MKHHDYMQLLSQSMKHNISINIQYYRSYRYWKLCHQQHSLSYNTQHPEPINNLARAHVELKVSAYAKIYFLFSRNLLSTPMITVGNPKLMYKHLQCYL